MSIADAFGPIIAQQRAEVLGATWGHLVPEPALYPGRVLCAKSEYNYQGSTVIEANFAEVPDSPWFYEALMEAVNRWIGKRNPGVYQFDGVCKVRSYKNGKTRFFFVGRVHRMRPRRWVRR